MATTSGKSGRDRRCCGVIVDQFGGTGHRGRCHGHIHGIRTERRNHPEGSFPAGFRSRRQIKIVATLRGVGKQIYESARRHGDLP